MDSLLKEVRRAQSKEKENKFVLRSRTQEEGHGSLLGNSQRKLKHNLEIIHAKLDLRNRKLREEPESFLRMRESVKVCPDVSTTLHNNSIMAKSIFQQGYKGSRMASLLSKEDSKISEKSELKGLSSLSIKREVIKVAKKMVPAEFVTIQTLLEISNDLQKAQAICRQLNSTDKSDFDEFFKKRQIKTKRGLFSSKKFVIALEVDGFLAKPIDTGVKVNRYALEIFKKHKAKLCFVAYTRRSDEYLKSFRKALGKDEGAVDCFLGNACCYIYEDKQLKSHTVIKEESCMIDSDLSTLYVNQGHMIYLPLSSSGKEFEKFNGFLEKLCDKLIERNCKFKEILDDLGLHYNLLNDN